MGHSRWPPASPTAPLPRRSERLTCGRATRACRPKGPPDERPARRVLSRESTSAAGPGATPPTRLDARRLGLFELGCHHSSPPVRVGVDLGNGPPLTTRPLADSSDRVGTIPLGRQTPHRPSQRGYIAVPPSLNAHRHNL